MAYGLMSRPYQGNRAWVACGLLALFIGAYIWRQSRHQQDAFERGQSRRLAAFIALLFGGIAVWQVLTHPW